MTDQLPAIIPPGALTTSSDTYTYTVVPTLIAEVGDAASWRFVEFTANINNDHTRRAYARACSRFFGWCETHGLTLAAIRPFHVAAWVKELQIKHSSPGVKQQLAAVRMLFDWLVTGQIVPMNPAAVRGPKHVLKTGKTPVLDGKEWNRLRDVIPTDTVRDLRDRALIATLTYSFARIGVALKMKVPCHHALAEALRAYIDAAHIAEDKKGWLFRTSPRHSATALTERPMQQDDAWRMVRRRAATAGNSGTDRQSHVSGNRHHSVSREWRRARACPVHGRA